MDDLSRLFGRLLGRFVGERDDPLDAVPFAGPDHPANDGPAYRPPVAAE